MNIRKIFCSLLALIMVFSLTGCETYDAFKAAFIEKEIETLPSIKVGVFEPLTGANASAAAEEIAGIELAHSYCPAVMGRNIELVYSDNQSDVSSCANAIESLLAQDVKFIIGSYKSILTLAASDSIKEAGIPAVSCTNTNPLITATNPYYFRVCCIDSYEGESAADYVLNCLKTSSAAILVTEGNDYASTLAVSFKEAFTKGLGEETYTVLVSAPAIEAEASEETGKKAGAKNEAEIETPASIEIIKEYAPSIMIPKDVDEEGYKNIFSQLEEINPDIIYFPGSSQDAGTVIPLSRLLGYSFNWLGTSQWNGISLEDVYYTIDFDPDEELSEMTSTFNKLYAQTYGADKLPTDSAALGFDAYLLVIEAISSSGAYAQGWQYAQALGNVTDMKGATGNITMDESGNPIKEITVEHSIDIDGKTVAVYSSIPSSQLREKIVVTSDAAVEK